MDTDVCIVGAGVAGLTLAQVFDGASFSVLLLESGGFNRNRQIQTLADGTAETTYPFRQSRARCFGGTSTLWAGVCLPLDASDFQQKSWLPYSGWPFERSHLLPYYQRAKSIFGLSDLTPTPPPSAFGQTPLDLKTMQLSNPLDLGRKYKQQIRRSPNVSLVTYANVTQLVPDSEGQRIVGLKIRGFSGQEFQVRSRTVILATGGIENARLLLASNSEQPNGLGNSYDLVGRFFMEHYFKLMGILPLQQQRNPVFSQSDKQPKNWSHEAMFLTNFTRFGSTKIQGTFGLADDIRRQQQLLNLHIRVYRYSLLEQTQAVIAAKQMQKLIGDGKNFTSIASQLRPILTQHPSILPRYVGWHIWNRLNKSGCFDHIRFQGWLEQEPDPENRIMLSHQRDGLGQPLPHLCLRFSQRMWDSLEQSLAQIDQALSKKGFARLQHDSKMQSSLYDKIGLHHMGTTRMHRNPRYGVVNEHCQVHDVVNLYIAGSSVFPTGGAANPTLTIAALALRLADRINQLYRHKN